jgi:hypothetical protein
VILLKYKDGEKRIIVAPEVPIVAYRPGSRDELQPGAKIMIVVATPQADGTLVTNSVGVGRDGLTPPM